MKTRYIQYYVEGDDEEKLVNTLKTKLRVIKTGKVQKFNVVDQVITDMRLRTLSYGTMVVLVFDTDTGSVDILKKNIKALKNCQAVSEIVLVPQVPNLEGEILRSCNIRKIENLLNSRSKGDFKRDILSISNLDQKLKEHQFNINLFWSQNPPQPYQNFSNDAKKLKLF